MSTKQGSRPRTRFNVEVTERDIANAIKSDSYRCVVAQAIARTVPDATHIDVDSQTIRFTADGERRIYLTPYAVQGYVIAFDAGDEIEPFSFQLRDPKRVARKVRTAAGKAADRARNVRRGHTSAVAAAKTADTASAKPAKASIAKETDSAAAAYGDAVKKTVSDRAGRRPPPRVFKTKRRAYGHRLLRINQEDSTEVDA